MSYSETLRKHARLTILRFLEEAPKYTSNVSMLAEQLPLVGISFTRDQVRTEITWLSEQGMVESEETGDFVVVTATTRGVEIAQGIARHPDVKRPRPGA